MVLSFKSSLPVDIASSINLFVNTPISCSFLQLLNIAREDADRDKLSNYFHYLEYVKQKQYKGQVKINLLLVKQLAADDYSFSPTTIAFFCPF